MASITLAVTAPHETAYDEDYPTRSTENYSHSLHDILQDMEDASETWYLSDERPSSAESITISNRMFDMIETVFDYADDAITSYRSSGDPSLSKPIYADLPKPVNTTYPLLAMIQWKTQQTCLMMLFKIYYMWETEEDPLLIKEKLQELLIAWPLLDTTIELSSELGQQFKVYPSWKNADLSV